MLVEAAVSIPSSQLAGNCHPFELQKMSESAFNSRAGPVAYGRLAPVPITLSATRLAQPSQPRRLDHDMLMARSEIKARDEYRTYLSGTRDETDASRRRAR